MSSPTTGLKDRLRADLTAAMKSRDKVRSRTIRSLLTAISEAEVAGASAAQLSDDELLTVLTREAKKRREADEAYTNAGRPELAEKEREEAAVLADYLPAALGPGEIEALVRQAIEQTGAAELGPRAIGKVMGALTPQTKGRADGAAVAAEARRQLAG